jgi:DNA polymerase III epsilon subunit-like protein
MFISLDLETTGLNKKTDKIIEFGAIKFDLNGHSETFQTLINPGVPIPEFITHITNIKNEDVENAPVFPNASNKIKEFIGDCPIIGHFIKFDMEFLEESGLKFENLLYDTSELARIFIPSLPSYSLEILSGILGLTHEEKHRALDDSIAAQELFLKLIGIIETLPKDLLEEIKSLSQKSDWDFAKVLKDIPAKTAESTTAHPVPANLPEKSTALPGKRPRGRFSSGSKNPSRGHDPGVEIFQVQKTHPGIAIPEIASKTGKTLILTPKSGLQPENFPNPDSQILHSPQDYISTKRLETFKQKQTLKPFELTALIKILIWLKDSPSGLLNEINFTPDEKSIIPRIHETEATSPFIKKSPETKSSTTPTKKTKGSSVFFADYAYEPQEKFKKIIITEPLKYLTFLQFHQGTSIWPKKAISPIEILLEIEPKNTALQKIKAKIEMLFGIIRSFTNEEILEITNLELPSPNWQKIKDLVVSMIALSQELKDIVREETSYYLKLWKEILKDLNKIFIEPDLENFHMWIHIDRNNEVSIKKIPIRPILPKHIEIMGEEDAELLKTILNSPETKVVKEETPNKKSKTNEPQQIFVVEDFIQGLSDFFIQFIKKEKGKNLIVMNSAMKLEQLLMTTAPKLKKESLSLLSSRGSGMGKSLELYKQSPETSSLLITPNKFQFTREEDFKNLIIQQLPFNPPSDQLLVALSKNFQDPFNELQVPLAIIALKNMIKNFKGEKIIILDNRIVTKNYSKFFLESLEKISKPLVVPAKTLIE